MILFDLEMKMDYQTSVIINMIGCLFLAHNGLSQRLTFQPNPVTVGGETDQPGNTPQELTMECTSDGISNIEGVYSFYLKRANVLFAEITLISNNPKIVDNAPTDIRNRNPTLEGRVGAGSNYIRVKYQVSTMTCQDEAQYQCDMNYKPLNSPSTTTSDTESLRLSYLPGNLQITASRTVNNFPQQIQNQTTVQYNDDIQYTCTGRVGENSATLIEWFMWDPITNMFGRYTNSVDDGIPGSVCPYTRTSTLRYRVTSSDRNYVVFRCQVSAQQHTAYSQEFHVRPPVLGISAASRQSSSNIPLLAAVVLTLAYATKHVATN